MSTPEKFAEMAEAAGGRFAEELNVLREKAEHFIAEEMQVMKERGDAVDLTPDELAMIKAYRNFVAKTPAGTAFPAFSWRPSFLDQPGIVFLQEPTLIVDPRDVSSGKICTEPHNYKDLMRPRDGSHDSGALRPY